MCAHHAHMPADHQANVLGEAVNQIEKSRTGVGVPGHHQTLRSTQTHTQERKHGFRFKVVVDFSSKLGF